MELPGRLLVALVCGAVLTCGRGSYEVQHINTRSPSTTGESTPVADRNSSDCNDPEMQKLYERIHSNEADIDYKDKQEGESSVCMSTTLSKLIPATESTRPYGEQHFNVGQQTYKQAFHSEVCRYENSSGLQDLLSKLKDYKPLHDFECHQDYTQRKVVGCDGRVHLFDIPSACKVYYKPK